MGFTWHNLNGMAYLTSDLLSATGLIKHGFSTRHGTLYGEVTDEFNLGYKKGDSIAIQQMRQVFLVSLGISLDNLVAGQQTHGAKVALVTEADAGRGAFSWEDGLPATDALVTGANVALSVYTADCVPLLFFDPVNGAIGAAHAGWRGSVRGIAVGTLQSLQHILTPGLRMC
jgi:copper oxidase (laccase) domain-containing protein